MSKKLYFVIPIVLLLFAVVIYWVGVDHQGGSTPADTTAQESGREERKPFMENHTKELTKEEKDKKEQSISALSNSIAKPVVSNNPNFLNVNNQQFFLFNNNVLLPLDNKEWKEYNVAGGQGGEYSEIHEYYLVDEEPGNWTQKFTIHKIKGQDINCYEFTDKLINGLIVNLTDQSTSNGYELTKENIRFNYVKKDPGNTYMYWGHTNVPGTQDETQFVRVFKGEYSGEIFLVTYTLKISLSSTSYDMTITSLQTLESVQELKEK